MALRWVCDQRSLKDSFKNGWIDFNAGQLLDGISMDDLLEQFLDYIVKVINNEIKAKNEINKFEEIAIFKDGVTL